MVVLFVGAVLLAFVCITNLVPTDTSKSVLDRITVTLLWTILALETYMKL
ncbi:TMhelix containing protein [Vibrio phage 1.161.O._10N.261.48.C5]|nr:TMhelix containing protein [Vibrio phage 1.161.O._10N.261.48.C5]